MKTLKALEQQKADHIRAMQKINMGQRPGIKTKSLVIKVDFDLRGTESKVWYVQSLPSFHKWVVFINKRANLAHIMHTEDTDSYIRMRLPVSLRGCSEEFVRRYFWFRMEGRYVL